ncbi:hypothetical protein DRQ07_02090, partial [candidate division KSB1 bacterium]
MENFQEEQQLTLQDYLSIIYRGRWIIIISFLAVMISTIYFTFTAKPVYESSATVMIKQEGSVQQQLFDVGSFMKQETMINNQREILTSRTLAEMVIKKLQNSPYADSLEVLGNGPDSKRKSFMGLILSLFKKGDENEPEPFNNLVRNFREGVITVLPKRDTDIIELKAKAGTPFEAALIANTWMEAYRELDVSESRSEVTGVRQFLQEQLEKVQKELAVSEEALKEYKEKEGVTALTAETEQLIQNLAQFESLYRSAQTDLQANEKRLEYLKEQLGENKKNFLSSNLSSPVIEELQKQMGQLIADIAAYRQQIESSSLSDNKKYLSLLQEKESRLKGIQSKIVEEKKKIIETGMGSLNPMAVSETLLTNILTLETENTALKARTRELRSIVRQYNKRLNKLPDKSLRLARLTREATVNNNIFMMLRTKYEENRIAEAGQIGLVRIVDRATPPERPISPKKKMNLLLGFFLGLGLGLGIVFTMEYLDTSLKTVEEVERRGIPVLGSVPLISPKNLAHSLNGNNGEAKQIKSRLITHFEPKSPISESYRTFRTNVQYTKVDNPVKTIVITSAGPGEGKSTTAANLAIAFAQMGVKTLIVDTDLRRPVQHGIFGVQRGEGFTNVLYGKVNLSDAVRDTEIDNLQLLTAGVLPPNPSELLASEAMEKFLKDVNSKFGMVIFDSPPVIAVTDAAVLSAMLDGVILVVKSGTTKDDALTRAKILLNNVNAEFLGVLVIGIDINRMYGSYYY